MLRRSTALTQRARRSAEEAKSGGSHVERVEGKERRRRKRARGAVPGEDDHHGVDVDGTVCDSLQDELFVCNRKRLVRWNSEYRLNMVDVIIIPPPPTG